MSFSADKLKSIAFSPAYRGFALGNKYDVIITPRNPATLTGVITSELRDLRFLCDQVALPVRSLATVDSNIYGAPTKLPYQSSYTEASLSFYLTESMAQKKLFDAWQEVIINARTGNVGFFNDYSCSVTISKYSSNIDDPDGNTADYAVRLLDAWPSIIGEVQLSHSAGNEVLKLPVTFMYRRWETVI